MKQVTKSKKDGKVWNAIQMFGRSLLLPIALLAPIGMIMGICNAFTQSYMIEQFPFLGATFLQAILKGLKGISSVVFSNIPLLFAMGVAYGISKKEKGIAVFASVVGYLTLNMAMNVYLKTTGTLADPKIMSQVGQGVILGTQTLKLEALGGIIAGLVAAKTTDKFYNLQLPLAFAFFSGKKSVPILTFAFMIPIGLVIPFFWQYVTKGLFSLSVLMMNKYVGPAIYMTANRLLIPFGLHHVLSATMRFTEAGGTYLINGQEYVGILNAMNEILFNLGPDSEYWAKYMPTLGSYMAPAGMLITLFRIPAICLAMYHTSYKKNRKLAKGVLLTVCLTAFLGNISEPFEFTLLFANPILTIVYAVMSGIGTIPLAFLDVSMGYIRGTIFDFAIFGLLYENTHWFQLVLVGLANAVVFYFVFKWLIVKLDAPTPGREDFEVDEEASQLLKEKRYPEVARICLEGLGGAGNIVNVENCVSRLRVDVKDPSLIDQGRIRESGCQGIIMPGEKHIHIVYGPFVEFVRNAFDDELKR